MSVFSLNGLAPQDLAPARFHEKGIWESAWKLLRLRAIIAWSGIRRAKLRRKIAYGFAALGIAVLLFFVVFVSTTLLSFMRSPELAQYIGDTSAFIESFPSLLIGGATAGILFTSFGVMLQALYLSGDMDFLMSAPIPVRSIFIAKLIQGILPNFGIMCLFSLPLLFGLGLSGGYSILYYPLTLLVLAALTLAASGLASLLVMVAARFFPARRMAEVLGFIVGTGIFVFSQTSRFMNFDVNRQQVSGMVNLAQRFNQPWSPLAWAGQGLVDLGKGAWLPGLGLTTASLVVAAAVFYIALVSAERMYYTGWSSLQNNRRARARKPAAEAAAQAGETRAAPRAAARPNAVARLLPAPVRAIVVKDWLLYRRDLRNVSRLLSPLILGIVYAVSLVQSGGQIPQGRGEAPAWVMQALQGIFVYADVGLALFMGWMLAANLAGLGFSMEGRRYWMLKVAPLGSRQLLLAKFLVSYIPVMLVCGAYVLVLQLLKGLNLWNLAISFLALAFILAGLNGIYLAFGVAGARFDWDNPNETGRTVGCLGSLVGMVYAPICFALFAGPPILAAFLELPVWAGQLVGLLLGGGAGLFAVLFPLGLVEKRVATLMEA
jgi:ABC-2 type transport system permease protein